MISAMSQTCQNYYDNLPDNIIPTIGQSACYTFAINLFVNLVARPVNYSQLVQPEVFVDISRALLNTGVAVLASAIYALTTPLFNGIMRKSTTCDWHIEMTKQIIVQVAVSILVGSITQSSIQLNSLRFFGVISFNSIISGYGLIEKSAHYFIRGQNRTFPPINDNSVFISFG